MPLKPLEPSQLYRHCEPSLFDFQISAEIADDSAILGQDRAIDALTFGIGMRRTGYNLFVLGPRGSGRHSIVHRFLNERARDEPTPDDWVYLHNFEEPHKPRALRLPPGRAARFRRDMERLVEDLQAAIPAMFESDEYRTMRQALEEEFKEKQEGAFAEIQREAQQRGLALLRTPTGVVLAPVENNEVMQPDAFNKLPEERRKQIERDIEELQGKLQQAAQKFPDWERDRRTRLRDLNRGMTRNAVSRLINALQMSYVDLPEVTAYLDKMEGDIVDNAAAFLPAEQQQQQQTNPLAAAMGLAQQQRATTALRRYQVNVVVSNEGRSGAPVATEDLPTLPNLIGRIEHRAEMGALVTDFTMIKPGALHRANGGYLVLDAARLLVQPYAWDALKRQLWAGHIAIQSPADLFSWVSTTSLEPEPIPLSVKVVLIGERQLYYLLSQLDPDFQELFKVEVDFEEDVDREAGTVRRFAHLVAAIARRHDILPLSREGMARIVERAARLAGDAEKLSIRVGQIADLLREADYWARQASRAVIGPAEVGQAIDAQKRRAGRVPDRMREAILRETVLIDTDGAKVGQINGLAVLGLGSTMFGRPSRITARVRMGAGEVVDIERRVELGGPIHAKGVLILSAFLGARYAAEHPLSLWASLVFEQSYSGVEGDSASSTELYALLSALSEVPISQGFAVTGSVNQFGEVQAIGGVNEKIEGFFDICAARGLTGRQGVLVPRSNVKHLMLRDDVVDAARQGRFHIYGVSTIDEGIELLTGRPAGEKGPDGSYPPDTVNRLVQDRLNEFADLRRRFGNAAKADRDEGKEAKL